MCLVNPDWGGGLSQVRHVSQPSSGSQTVSGLRLAISGLLWSPLPHLQFLMSDGVLSRGRRGGMVRPSLSLSIVYRNVNTAGSMHSAILAASAKLTQVSELECEWSCSNLTISDLPRPI